MARIVPAFRLPCTPDSLMRVRSTGQDGPVVPDTSEPMDVDSPPRGSSRSSPRSRSQSVELEVISTSAPPSHPAVTVDCSTSPVGEQPSTDSWNKQYSNEQEVWHADTESWSKDDEP